MSYSPKVSSLILVSLAAAALFSACSDAPEKSNNSSATSCMQDADCSGGSEVCEGDICVQGCSGDADCLAAEECSPRSDGTLGMCTPRTVDETCLVDVDCSADEVCEDDACVPSCILGEEECGAGEECVAREFGDGAYCSALGTNNLNNTNNMNNLNNANNTNNGGTQRYIVQILDTSTGESCEFSDPGSDIIFVSLEESSGAVLGYGNLVSDGTTGETNDYNLGVNLDGSAPSFTGECPEFHEDNLTSLGCGGYVALEFWDANGAPIAFETGMNIRVFEYGGQCSTGSTTDEFDIILCSDTNAVKNNDDMSSCTTNLGGGSGETTVTIL